MKFYCTVTITLCLLSLSCTRKPDVSLPLVDQPGEQWATFEGKIFADEEEIIEVELSLKEAPPGVRSRYELNGIVVTEKYTSGWQGNGEYEVTPLGDGSFGIVILGDETGQGVASDAFFKRNIDRMRNVPSRPNGYRGATFYFITTGDGRLALTDESFNRLAKDDRFTVFKRSNLFTIEGYVTLEQDSSLEFFERNTFQDWHVTQLGMYNVVKEKYVHLAKEPWEGIYVRALAYSVADTTDTSGQRTNLVVKKLIAMGETR